MQFLVIQAPKHKFRDMYSTSVMVVEADSAAAAVRTAIRTRPDDFGPSPDFSKVRAEPLVIGYVHYF